MKYLGVCLQRLPREGHFYRHQTSSQLQPTFRPEVAGAPEPTQEPGAAAATAAHLPVGPRPGTVALLIAAAVLHGLQATGVTEFQGKCLQA